jgi:hypothetical protein
VLRGTQMKAPKICALVSVASLFLLLAIAAHQGAVKAESADSGFIDGADRPFHAISYRTLVSCPFNSIA